MFGTGDPTPYDVGLFVVLVALTILLVIGAATAGMWPSGTAAGVRRGAVLLALAATAAVMIRTPTTNGIIGAARLLFIWPALAAACLTYVLWSWRAGSL